MARWPKDEKGKPDKAGKSVERKRSRTVVVEADWSSADAGLISEVIVNVTSDGGAVRFGYSRDGGAYSLGVYGDGAPYTEYLGATEDVDAWLGSIALDYE